MATIISNNHPKPDPEYLNAMFEAATLNIESKKKRWSDAVKDAPILYDYLREKYQEEL